MVEGNCDPRLGPKRSLSAKAGVRFFIAVTIFVLCGFVTAGRGKHHQETHTGRSLLWHVNEFPEDAAQNCTPPAISDFPPDFFTSQQRRSGGILVHIIICLYLFILLAMICDDYFVPCIEKMCENLNVSEDIAGATFMAAAVSSPEFFINVVGTFITEGDIGVGTVVGSAVFNVLAVPACCGLFAKKVNTQLNMAAIYAVKDMICACFGGAWHRIMSVNVLPVRPLEQVVKLNWWSLTRDCAIYSVAVCALMLTVWDGRIEWYESLVLVSLYIFYILAMYYNGEASKWMNAICCRKRRHGYVKISEENVIAANMNGNAVPHAQAKAKQNGHADMNGHLKDEVQNVQYSSIAIEDLGGEEDNNESCLIIANCFKKVWWLFTGPIDVMLAITIPDCKSEFWKRFYFLTFFMCILWIGATSYLVAWMITTIGGMSAFFPGIHFNFSILAGLVPSIWKNKFQIFYNMDSIMRGSTILLIPDSIIGDTFKIPDSVMGLTFLAAGMSVPEAVSSVIVTNQGHGSMGISNSIGSNTFDILLCLGLPWLMKATLLPATEGSNFVQINSGGLSYSVISLFTTLLLLYITFFLNNFKLDYKAGFVCLVIYVIFLVTAALIELNIFFPVNLPICGS